MPTEPLQIEAFASTSTVFAARSSGTRAASGERPSVTQNPSASSSSCPGVRMVTATGSPPTRISSGSSTARISSPSTPPEAAVPATPVVEYGGAFEETSLATWLSVLAKPAGTSRSAKGQLAMAQIAYTVTDQLGMNASVSVALAR